LEVIAPTTLDEAIQPKILDAAKKIAHSSRFLFAKSALLPLHNSKRGHSRLIVALTHNFGPTASKKYD